jgi:two-component system sensor histidine kinase SenX3
VAIIEDISERRRLEAVRRDFVANISHELKTPVGALSLVAETLEGEDDPAVVARLSHRMRTEAERLGRIIEDLLDLSRIEAEEFPSREPVPVHLVVAQAVERLRPAAEHRGIRLDIEEPPRSFAIRGDRRQLVSAVHNLVDNAIKYSEDGSSVQVTIGQGDGWVTIAVADHGIGIPTRDLERIFERFYRVDRARSRDTGGTGLGLAIVRHVASNHGGHVEVCSREGEGSTFTLRLPGGPGAVSLHGMGSKEVSRG